MRAAVAVWVIGLFTAVPWATYHLLFEAPRSQYAGLIVFILFWIFGYWSLVGPLLTALMARRVWRAMERARSREELATIITSPDAREVTIDLIASENHVPRFVATWVYRWIAARITAAASHER
jgi:hypothetical protein